MKLNRLVATQSWEEVWAALVRLYPNQEKGMEGYRYVFETLKTLTPSETIMRICIEAAVDETREIHITMCQARMARCPRNRATCRSSSVRVTVASKKCPTASNSPTGPNS